MKSIKSVVTASQCVAQPNRNRKLTPLD